MSPVRYSATRAKPREAENIFILIANLILELEDREVHLNKVVFMPCSVKYSYIVI